MTPASSPPRDMPLRRQLPLLVLLAAAFFAAIAPTLRWPQFSGDGEDNLVETVLEMRRGGPWFVPNLGGVPRLRKPPLAAWVTASAVSPGTVARLDSADPAARDAAYRDLALQVRWPALAAGAVILVGAGLLGRLVGGSACGFLSLLVCGSTLMFLRFARGATTDVQLALWVTLTNVGLAAAILAGRRWLGCCAAGVTLGLALMSKDPVAPLETVLPAAVYAVVRWALNRRQPDAPELPDFAAPGSAARWWPPVVVGLLLTLAVALPWWGYAYLHHPEMTQTLKTEFAGEGARNVSSDPVFAYLVLLPLNMVPWTPLLVAGIYIACRLVRRDRRVLFALTLLVVPLFALTFHITRKDRYLVPMIAPAAVLTAYAAAEVMKSVRARDLGEHVVRWTHWGLLAVLAVGVPLVGILRLKNATKLDGTPWFSLPVAVGIAAGGAAILGVGAGLYRRRPAALVVTGAALMLWLNVPLIRGWSQSAAGVSEMKPIADRLRAEVPGGLVVYYDPVGDKPVTMDLDIYLNRPVPVVRDAAAAPRDAAAMVCLRRERAAEPAFAGWEKRFDLVSPKHRYHFYVFVPEGS